MTAAATLASPAQAVQAEARGCTTFDASGLIYATNWTSPSSRIDIEGEIADRSGAGQHARIRLLTEQGDGDVHEWKWRKRDGGGYRVFETTAQDQENGIFRLGVEVARFDDDGGMLNSCVDWGNN